MDLSLTQAQEMLKSTAQDFIQREYPKEKLLELDKTDTGCTPELWERAAALGWLGMPIPAEYGGEGLSLTDTAVLFQELGRGPIAGPHFSSGILGSLLLLEAATDAQKRDWLPQVCRGSMVLAAAISDPDRSWGPGAVQMTPAQRNGDYVLNGTKLFVQDAAMATHLLCAIRTGQASTGQEADGIALLLVDANLPGVAIRTLPGFIGQATEITFHNVPVPQANLLGESPGNGWQALDSALQKALPILCAYQVGGCEAVFDMSVAYSRTRVQFGTPVGRFQRVQDHIINLVNHLDAARWTTYEALWKLDTDRPARDAVHLAKAVTAEAHYQACNYAHEVHAGVGSMIEYGLAMHTKTSRTLYAHLGDPKYHRRQLAHAIGL